MLQHIADLIADALKEVGCELNEAKIAVLGYSYLEDSDDTRHTPTAALLNCLSAMACEATVHDPFVEEYQGDVLNILRGANGVIVMVAHSNYRELDLAVMAKVMRQPVLVDGRHIFTAKALH